MGLFDWLTRKRSREFTTFEGDGSYELEVVGESNYQEALNRLAGGKTEDGHEIECIAMLIPEPDNRHDPNAVMVQIEGKLVGYLSRDVAQAMTMLFKKHNLAGAQADAIIVGGWSGRRGRKSDGHYGVRLDIET